MLLGLIQNVEEKHNENKVLESCAKALEVLCDEEYAIYPRCELIRNTIIDRLVKKLRVALDNHRTRIAGVSLLTNSFSRLIEINVFFV